MLRLLPALLKKDLIAERFAVIGWFGFVVIWASIARFTPTHPLPAPLLILLNLIAGMLMLYLVVATIQSDPACGYSPDWKTRPIPGPVLAIEKLLFPAAVISLPLLASSLYALSANGFAIAPLLPDTFSHQALLFMIFLMPIAATASITESFTECLFLILLSIGSPLLWIAIGSEFNFVDIDWGGETVLGAVVFGAVVGFGSMFVTLLAYGRSRRRLAISVFAGGWMLMLALVHGRLWPAAFKYEVLTSHAMAPMSRISVDPLRESMPADSPGGRSTTVRVASQLIAPVAVTGLPGTYGLVCDRALVRLVSGSQELFQSNWISGAELTQEGQLWWLSVPLVNQPPLTNLKSVDVDVELAITILGNGTSTFVPVPSLRVMVPDVGICSATAQRFHCLAPFGRHLVVTARSHACDGRLRNLMPKAAPVSYSSLAIPFGLSIWSDDVQVDSSFEPLGCKVEVSARPVLWHQQARLHIQNGHWKRYPL